MGLKYGSTALAHRVSWELHGGANPAGKFILQRCKHKNCVNPDHLFLSYEKPRKIQKPLRERFWERVRKTNGCWLWLGAHSSEGYGEFYTGGLKFTRAHRYSWELHFGKLPTNQVIYHTCGNPLCVRPEHLHRGDSDTSSDLSKRFWRRVRKTKTCWLWIGTKNSSGYGTLWVKERNYRASHLAWLLHHGPVPKSKFVLHRCDQPACVRPDHLFIGDNQLNTADKVSKGRQAKGEATNLHKLKEVEVIEIIARLKSGESLSALADEFNVTYGNILAIRNKRSWKHLPR